MAHKQARKEMEKRWRRKQQRKGAATDVNAAAECGPSGHVAVRAATQQYFQKQQSLKHQGKKKDKAVKEKNSETVRAHAIADGGGIAASANCASIFLPSRI